MNVTTRVALTAEYKTREWYHLLAEYGTKFDTVKDQIEHLFTKGLQ